MMMAEKKTNGLTFLLDSRSQFFVTGMHNDRVALVFFFLFFMKWLFQQDAYCIIRVPFSVR
jgi:hypothetical protein